MGAPACQKSLAVWYSDKERGSVFGLWSAAHNFGAALVPPLVALALVIFGITEGQKMLTGSQMIGIFLIPSIMSAVMVVIILLLGSDSPVSMGLPPVEIWKGEVSPEVDKNEPIHEEEADAPPKNGTVAHNFLEFIIKNKYLWILGFANAFSYAARFGIADWIPIYLSDSVADGGKGMDKAQATIYTTVLEFIAIGGAILIGIISDKWCKGRRGAIAGWGLIVTIPFIYIYAHTQSTVTIGITTALMGFFIYAATTVVGMLTIQLVPHFAVGSATGFIGFFGYILGELTATAGLGWVSDKYNWNTVFTIIMGICVLGALCFLVIGRKETKDLRAKEKLAAEKA
jgi:OPA family glycerol-3-phosphate transporter-like MFS transporter